MATLNLQLEAIWSPGYIVDNRVLHLSVSGIVGTAGEVMSTPYTATLFTRMQPLLVSPNSVVAAGGSFIPSNLPTSTLLQLIWFYSKEALSLMGPNCSPDRIKKWLALYTRSAVVLSLLNRSCSDASLSKKLGDLTVSRGAGSSAAIRASLQSDLADAERMIEGCGFDASREMTTGVRGDLNLTNRRAGRDVVDWDGCSLPLANDKAWKRTRHGIRYGRKPRGFHGSWNGEPE